MTIFFITATTKSRRSWTSDQNTQFEIAFREELKAGVYPTTEKLTRAIREYPCLAEKTRALITSKFQNILNKKKKMKNHLKNDKQLPIPAGEDIF